MKKKLINQTPNLIVILMLIVIIGTILCPSFLYNRVETFKDYSVFNQNLVISGSILLGILLSIICYYASKMAKIIRNDLLFEEKYVSYLKNIVKISTLMLLIISCGLVYNLIMTTIGYITLLLVLSGLIIGLFTLVMIILRELFRKGFELEKEVEGLV